MHYKNSILLIILYFNFISVIFSQNFVSIKSESNLRAGPGKQYPINWTLKLRNMPVKILEKNSSYTKVELYDGTKGWVWNATISKKNYYIVIEDSYIINKNKENTAFVKKNVLLDQVKCGVIIEKKEYCRVSKENIKGYLYKKSIWGINNFSQ